MNLKKKIFIGSSTESSEIATALSETISNMDANLSPIPWQYRENTPGEYFIPDLIKTLNSCDFAIFVFSSDDELIMRGQKGTVPRANVIFEYGLAIGMLGQNRCYILRPDDSSLILPTDFLGVAYATYREVTNEISASLVPATRKLKRAMDSFNIPQMLPSLNISWKDFCVYIEELTRKLNFYPGMGGFQFDVIVGLQRGGLVVADMLSRFYDSRIPVHSLFQDRRSKQPEINFDCETNEPLIKLLKENDSIKHILITEDITRTGHAIVKAKDYLEEKLPDKNFRSAAIVLGAGVKPSVVDYYVYTAEDKHIQTPISIFDGK